MKWRLFLLLALVGVALAAEFITLSSQEYTDAHLIAGAALVAAVFLAYLWWKLLSALTRILMKTLLFVVALGVAWQVAQQLASS